MLRWRACGVKYLAIGQSDGAHEAIRALGKVRPRLNEERRRTMVLRFQAMPDHRFDGQRTGDFALFLAANPVRQNVEVERALNLEGVLVVLADAPDMRVAANFNTQGKTSVLGSGSPFGQRSAAAKYARSYGKIRTCFEANKLSRGKQWPSSFGFRALRWP